MAYLVSECATTWIVSTGCDNQCHISPLERLEIRELHVLGCEICFSCTVGGFCIGELVNFGES